jgi:hypothetical protein
MSLFEENAEVLRRFAADGIDLGRPRRIDFSLVFRDRTTADDFARAADPEGFSTVVEVTDRTEGPWEVTASRKMSPTSEAITAWETRLDALAGRFGGRADGWGFLSE